MLPASLCAKIMVFRRITRIIEVVLNERAVMGTYVCCVFAFYKDGNFSFVMQIEGNFCLYVRQKNYFNYNSVKLRDVNGKV